MIEFYYDVIKREDYPVIGERTFGIIDGATPIGGDHDVLIEYIKNFAAALLKDENLPLKESVDWALRVTDREEYDVLKAFEKPCASMGVVRVFDDRIEIVRAADVTVVIKLFDDVVVLNHERISRFDQAAWDEALALMNNGVEPEKAIMQVLTTTLRKNREHIGKDYFPIAPGIRVNDLMSYVFPREGVEAFAAMSDGFSRYFHLTGSDYGEVFNMNIIKAMYEMRMIEKELDPRNADFPFFSRHDDASVIIVRL